MLEETTLTDVSAADSSVGVQDTAASSVSIEEQPAQPSASSDVTAQVGAGGQEDDTDGRSHFIPSEELEANPDRIAKALLRVQQSHERLWEKHRPLQSLESWKDVAQQFNDPAEVITNRDLIDKIHSPVIDPVTQQPKSGAFTTAPFLTDLEAQSPGTVLQMVKDSLSFQLGERPLWQALMRDAFGLDPERIDDYRQIDSRAPAGVVTQDQLVGIDPKYHDAFKALSEAQREDILFQRDRTTGEYPPAVMDYLQDKSEALEARKWRDEDSQRRQAEAQQQQQAFEQETVNAVNTDISTIRREMYDSIHKSLAQQWKPSSDEFTSNVEYRKVMGTLASLLDPDLRWTAEEALKDAGTPLDAKFDEMVSTFAGAREAYIRFTRQGDQMRAKMALSQGNLAKAQLKTKLDEYALTLAKPSAERLQTQSQQTVNSLTAATSRIVPSGNVQTQNGNGNPYDANPYSLGTPESKAWNKNMDRQLGANGATGLTA